MSDPRRSLPRVDDLLGEPRISAAAARLGRKLVHGLVSAVLDEARAGSVAADAVVATVVARLPGASTGLRGVINATGVIVHTNLGRAPLSVAAVEAVALAAGYTDIEFDLESAGRSKRGRAAVAALLAAVPRAESAHVVNNNAAALTLLAAALAGGREIILSRGEFIEIGAGFRIPDLLTAAGARLREVGCTNRTTVADYADAIGPDTALILKLHPSNFHLSGFTGSAPVRELAGLPVPVAYDIGSGLLTRDSVLPDEPDVTTALRDGAAIVTASGDKLLGGPQAGLVFGRAELVTAIARHPLARAMRVDKLTLAALEATVLGPPTPVFEALHATVDELRERAELLSAKLRSLEVCVVDSVAAVGGGGAPEVELPSVALSLPAGFAVALRRGQPPVVGRILDDRCLLDLRTVPSTRDGDLIAAVSACG